jgi:hypothetical protein
MKHEGFIDPITLGFIIVGIIAILGASGCAFMKKSENSMKITAEYEADRLKHLNVECGRDEDVESSVDKAVIK